jgi:hypothetical protein
MLCRGGAVVKAVTGVTGVSCDLRDRRPRIARLGSPVAATAPSLFPVACTTSGRGNHIVPALAADSGVIPHPPRKIVRLEIAERRSQP